MGSVVSHALPFAFLLTNFDGSATELGTYAAYANQYSSYEVILATDLVCSAQVISTLCFGKEILILHATDQVSSDILDY